MNQNHESEERRHYFSAIKWQLINVAGRQVVSLILFATLARLLTKESFGQAGICFTLISVIALISDLGMSQALIQVKTLDKETFGTALSITSIIAATMGAVLVIANNPVASLLGDPYLGKYVAASGALLILNCLSSFPNAVFAREQKFKAITIRTVAANIVGGLAAIGFALMGLGTWSLFLQQAIAAIIGGIIAWRAVRFKPTFALQRNLLRSLLGVGMPLAGSSVVWFTFSRQDQFFTSRWYGQEAVALIILGGRIPEILRAFVAQPFGETALASLARLQDDKEKMRGWLENSMSVLLSISLPVFVGLALVTREILLTLYGKNWIDAIPYMTVWCGIGFINAFQVFFSPALIAQGRSHHILWVNIVYGVGLFSLINIFGKSGAFSVLCCSLAASSLAWTLHYLIQLRTSGLRLSRVLYTSRGGIAGTGAIYIIIALLSRLDLPLIASLITKITAGLLAYISTSKLIDPLAIDKALNMVKRNPKTAR